MRGGRGDKDEEVREGNRGRKVVQRYGNENRVSMEWEVGVE